MKTLLQILIMTLTLSVSLSAQIFVTSPNGGEIWTVGENRKITWTSHGATYVNILYSIDDGQNYSSIVDSVIASVKSFQWTIPNTPSTMCRVRVMNPGDPPFLDESNRHLGSK